uniref:G-protein coupled receptors family 1 profile domain-containing protein n=1 Tax=Mastacembelus armatus TaxID=205130 RepID=A0A3Q3MDG9_9TELE
PLPGTLSYYYQRILLPVSYSLVFVLALSLNGALLWCVCWSSTVIYMTNLAVADLLYVLALPPLVITNAMGDLLHCSMMFLGCVSVHRFVGMCFPISSVRLRTNKTRPLCVRLGLGPGHCGDFTDTGFCAHGCDECDVCFEMTNPQQFNVHFPYGLFLVTVGFLLPFLIVITCYCLYCKAAGGISTGRTARMRNTCAHTLFAVCLMFVVCFVPYHVTRNIYLFVRVYLPGDCHVMNAVMIAYEVWKPAVSFNCCANSLLYISGSGRYREKLRAWLRRRKTRVQPNICPVDIRSTNRFGK